MRFNVLTLFPEMFSGFLSESMARRAVQAGLIEVNLYNIRDYSKDKHHRADDYPFGGGAGLVMMPQPLFDCFYDVQRANEGRRTVNVYMTPKGEPLTGKIAEELSGYEAVNILCGHYEGIDQRVIDRFIEREISIGDYVLTGGELPAMILIDCAMRFVPGVLGNEASGDEESFSDGLLEYPQYTRPYEYEGLQVPDVVLSGHHANIRAWRRQKSLEETLKKRPDLIEKAALSKEDIKYLEALKDGLET
jgi:tRNA (guanine37-N1)-methyltransferase